MTAAPANRIRRYVEQPEVEYSHVVKAALATMHRLMGSMDNATAFQAANAVLEIEKARLRHKMPLAGTESEPTATPRQQPTPVEEKQDEQVARFEKAVEEFVVESNKQLVQNGQPEHQHEAVRNLYLTKLQEVGFEDFLCWHDWMMGRRAEKPTQRKIASQFSAS
jgi:hypothetical protein